MREAASRWIEAGRGGNIINLASFAGIVADPMSAPYAATKGAVVQLTRTCAVEWAPHGIRVNAIGPGYVRTEMTADTLDTPEAGEVIRQKTALGRAARPDEIAGAAIYLASAASSYVTGHILMVDGGWTAL
jgi:NAD(P)-dependent dehydrogenase (short-subunit alcohol dehydrogenase family)